MFDNILLPLQDPENPTLGPCLKVMRFFGMWAKYRSTLGNFIHYLCLVFLVIYLADVYIFNIAIMKFRFDYFLVFIQYSICQLGVFKFISFTFNQKGWEQVAELVAEIEKGLEVFEKAVFYPITEKTKKISQLILVGFWMTLLPLNISYLIVFAINQIFMRDISETIMGTDNLFNAWLPLDINTMKGRAMDIAVQLFFAETAAIYILCWDTIVLQLMLFLIGQFKSLRLRCVHLLDESNEELCFENIVKCHQLYLKLIKLQRLLNSLITWNYLGNLSILTVNYGVCVILLIWHKDNLIRLISTFVFVFAVSIESLIHYWIGDVFINESTKLSYSIFECSWVGSSARVRRAVFMLGMGMRQRMTFTAGPFNEMSLTTYILVVKTSYSFYTLLNREN